MLKLEGKWNDVDEIDGIKYECGHCGSTIAPTSGYFCTLNLGFNNPNDQGKICICPNCNMPTFLRSDTGTQIPGPMVGREISNLPSGVDALYKEARKCVSVSAYTSSVLACRKILMNIAVHEGATENLKFVQYVDYLEQENFIPKKARAWVDKIRQKGNEATHEISSITNEDAMQLLKFTEILLIFVYEFADPVEEA